MLIARPGPQALLLPSLVRLSLTVDARNKPEPKRRAATTDPSLGSVPAFECHFVPFHGIDDGLDSRLEELRQALRALQPDPQKISNALFAGSGPLNTAAVDARNSTDRFSLALHGERIWRYIEDQTEKASVYGRVLGMLEAWLRSLYSSNEAAKRVLDSYGDGDGSLLLAGGQWVFAALRPTDDGKSFRTAKQLVHRDLDHADDIDVRFHPRGSLLALGVTMNRGPLRTHFHDSNASGTGPAPSCSQRADGADAGVFDAHTWHGGPEIALPREELEVTPDDRGVVPNVDKVFFLFAGAKMQAMRKENPVAYESWLRELYDTQGLPLHDRTGRSLTPVQFRDAHEKRQRTASSEAGSSS